MKGCSTRRSDRPIYQQLADLLREQIISGAYRPGTSLPSEQEFARQLRVGREVVRQALGVLRAEGLVTTSRGRRTRIRVAVDQVATGLGRGDRAIVRMPSEPERRRQGFPEGVAVVDIRRVDGSIEVHPADRVELVGGGGGFPRPASQGRVGPALPALSGPPDWGVTD